MNPFRCSNCNKLLGMIEGKAEIKCPKCKTVNTSITFGKSPIESLIPLQLYQNGKITWEEFEESLGIPNLCDKPTIK
jgi:LSD1 subclass zinc finger protein